MKEAYITLC